MAKELFYYCEKYFKLYLEQIGRHKERSAIDIVTIQSHIIYENWEEKKPATAPFIDVKKTFDHISKMEFVIYIWDFGIDNN